MGPSTPQALSDLSELNRVLKGKAPFSVFDDRHPDFCELSKTLHVVSSSLHKEGIGAHQKNCVDFCLCVVLTFVFCLYLIHWCSIDFCKFFVPHYVMQFSN